MLDDIKPDNIKSVNKTGSENTSKNKENSTFKASGMVDIAFKLKSQGVFPTQQRMIIANVLFARNQHLTADQVDDLVRENNYQVSKATIYNTLGLFVKKKLLNEIHIDSSRTFYDTNAQDHQHFYNVDSGELIDIDIQPLPEFIQEQLPDSTQVESVDIIVRIKNH